MPGLPLMIDATSPPPFHRPTRMAATSSCIRRPNGSAGTVVAIGGVIVDGGRFDWEKSG